MKKKGMSKGGMMAAGVGAAALGAGAYYLMGPNAKAHQKKAKVLMGKIKSEVAREVKKAKVLGTPMYHKAVDMVSAKYAKEYKMHTKDINALAKKLKGEFKGAKKIVKKTVRAMKKKI